MLEHWCYRTFHPDQNKIHRETITSHKHMHTSRQAVTFQVGEITVQQVKNVGAGGWPSARGQKVVVFTSHRDNP